MFPNIRLVLLFIYMVNNCSKATRILAYFPMPSISHQVVFRPLMQELHKRGHELVIITPDPVYPKGQTPQNISEIDVHDFSYRIWKNYMKTEGANNPSDLYNAMEVISVIINKQIESVEVQELIRKREKFDLLFIEAFALQTLEITHIFKAPVIQISSFGAIAQNYYVMGVPRHPIIYPMNLKKRLYNLTLWEKINDIYYEIMTDLRNWKVIEAYNNNLKKRYGLNAPTLSELEKNVDMLFLNIHPLWECNRPVPPGVIHINALHLKPGQELPKDLKTYLDSSVNGVIYMSLGTNVQPSFLSSRSIEILLKVFSKLPYNVLLKWDADLPDVPKNVNVSKWFPQSELLKHKNIKLFITQGGLQSTDEALAAGVPLIVFPMLGDQFYNAENYVYYKIGIKLDISTITEEIFKSSIETVINNESYRHNVLKLRTLMTDLPQTSLERAVWWTEYVIRHGGAKHYRSPMAGVTWSDYLMLDIVLPLLLATIIIVIIILTMLTYILKRISRLLKVKSKIKNN